MAEDAEFFADDLDVEERIGEGGGFTHAVASVRTVDNNVDDGAMTGVLTADKTDKRRNFGFLDFGF